MLELRSVSYRYAGARRDAVRDCSLRVERGERVALVGRNGSGKSTLLSLCKGGVSPSSGEILVDGVSAGRDGARLLQEGVGILRQDPRGQLVSSLVEEELAFGPQNLGIGGEELGRRVREALRLCGVEDLAHSRTMGLSGGQMQRVALAAVLAMGPLYLMLDEPCAQLDPRARQGIRSSLAVLAGRGVGMLLASHLPEDIASADRVLVMEAGRICWEGRPLELFSDAALLARAGVLGDSADALNALARRGVEPREALAADATTLRGLVEGRADGACVQSGALRRDASGPVGWGTVSLGGKPTGRRCGGEASHPPAGVELALDDVSVSYEAGAPALSHVSLVARGGRLTLLAGESGSGKTTASLVAAGVLEPDGGKATLLGRPVRPSDVGLAFQRPEDQLFCATALEDVSLGPGNLGESASDARRAAEDALRRMGVGEEAWPLSPLEGSGGERRRVALAGVIAMRRSAYVFDEPTAGLDGAARVRLEGQVGELVGKGAAVVVVSHDLDEWLPLVDDVCLLRAGRVVWQGRAAELERQPGTLGASGLGLPLYLRLREALHA
ncbi:ABC transporter ATP-binding protein [Olsenella sp. DNF00959]|uniref:ABC transporter ATP-binding protein n=1 Tax=Olsenella sp. DNF00959 TaxID=1476999 RepID=UPI00078531B2|nr:ATP-binding cassette domain-containing protein [Olsenella sp. DNF00959]KXB61805.1 cobalt ABC transporter, ATP-binding protein [Olsenella sp. DNF00959]